jgi:myo-inositol-1(or 4)-monophosphatase
VISKDEFEKHFSDAIIEKIIVWIKVAGEIALNYFYGNSFLPQAKADNSFVTKADVEVESFIFEKIASIFPDHQFIGEEISHYSTQLNRGDFVWVVDPIDGTTAYMQGLPGWGISISVLYRETPQLGFYYMPLLKDLTYIDQKGRVFCNGRQLFPNDLRRDWRNKGFLALTSAAHVDFEFDINNLRALGSITTNLVYTARGTAVATFIPKAYLWDLVAGAAILSGLGGELRYLDGTAVDYRTLLSLQLAPQPIIAGHPNITSMLPPLINRKTSE